MRKLLTALTFSSVLLSPFVAAETLSGRVVSVADGDTITVLDAANTQHRIRLLGIDAPERRQAFGNVSRTHLRELVHSKDVSLECPKIDRYKRKICTVYLAGNDINLQQIGAGLAWWYRDYARDQRPEDRERYEDAEFAARAGGIGLWRDANPIPPWAWRRDQRRKNAK